MSERPSRADKTIFIASSSFDEPTWSPVAQSLADRGYNVVAYEADKVADGTTSLEVRVSQDEGLNVRYDNCDLALTEVGAAWFRRPTMFSEELEDRAFMLSLDTERALTQNSLWEAVPASAWLNQPARMRRAEHKLTQLVVALEVGFVIPPDTVVTLSLIHI